MELLRDRVLLGCGGGVVTAEMALPGAIVGLYFAADWCQSSQSFTPILKQFYSQAKERGNLLRIVYMSCDRSDEEMERFMSKCPQDWLALSHSDPINIEMRDKFQISLVPKLLIVKEDGELITSRGRKEVDDRGIVAYRLWIDNARLKPSTHTPGPEEQGDSDTSPPGGST